MKTNTARDLLLLAAVAFENKQFSEAGALFATALSSDDAPQLLETLNNLSIQEQAATASAGEKRMSLREVSQALSAAIEETVGEGQPGVATASDDEDELEDDEELDDAESEDEDEDSDDEDDEEDDGVEGVEDDEDEESDDVDPDEGGETILPSSISSVSSSVAVKRKEGASKLIISGVGGVNTPIKLKQ